MKQFIFAAVFICTFLSSAAQEVSWSNETAGDNTQDDFEVIGETEKSIFFNRTVINKLYVHSDPKILLQRYNKSTKQQDVSKTLKGLDGDYCGIKLIKDKLILFYQTREDGEKVVYGQLLDEDFNYSGKAVEVSRIKEKLTFKMSSNPDQPTLYPEIIVSTDSASLFCLQIAQQEGKHNLVCSQFSPELVQKGKFEKELSYSEKAIRVTGFASDKGGNQYIVIKVCGKDESTNSSPDFVLDLYILNQQTKLFKSKQLLHGELINELRFDMSPNGKLILSGLIDNRGVRMSGDYGFQTIGYFFYSINQNAEIEPIGGTEGFTSALAGKMFLFNLKYKAFIPFKEGGGYLIAEQRWRQGWLADKSITGKYGEFGLYNDIAVIKLNPEYKAEWSITVPKRQMSKSGSSWEQTSFDVFRKDKKLFFVFNDTPENPDAYTTPAPLCKWKNLGTYVVTVDESGAKTKKVLATIEDTGNAVLFPGMGLQDAKLKSPIIYAGNKKVFKFGSLKLE